MTNNRGLKTALLLKALPFEFREQRDHPEREPKFSIGLAAPGRTVSASAACQFSRGKT